MIDKGHFSNALLSHVSAYILVIRSSNHVQELALIISQAFAVMKKLEDGSDVYYLQERLAAEAGKEFFIDNSATSGLNVENKLLSVLEMHISKSSEWFLA